MAVYLDSRIADYMLGEHTRKYMGYRMEREAQTYDVPLGLTWAAALPTDREDRDQPARERANSLWLERYLEDLELEDGVDVLDGVWVFRILNLDGSTADWAAEIAEVVYGLEDYPVATDEILSEVEALYFDDDWENEVVTTIENDGALYGRREGKVYAKDAEDLPDGWQDQLYEKYRELASHDDYDDYDDRGYSIPSIDTVIVALRELGWEHEDDD